MAKTRPALAGSVVNNHGIIEPNEAPKAKPKTKPVLEVQSRDLNQDTSIDPNNLEGEYISLSRTFLHYARMKAKAKKEQAVAKLEATKTRAEVSEIVRSSLLARGEKVTEALIANTVTMDARVLNAELEVIEAQERVDMVAAAVESIVTKKEMLVSMGADRRQEIGMGIRMKHVS